MIRMLNLVCVALMGLSILALYHVSEKTRVAHMQLSQAKARSSRRRPISASWKPNGRTSPAPERIQQLAQAKLNMADTASVQLSSFDQLPRKGDAAPLNNSPVRNASAQVPATFQFRHVRA